MKYDFTARTAAIFCAVLMIFPDVARSAVAHTTFAEAMRKHEAHQHLSALIHAEVDLKNETASAPKPGTVAALATGAQTPSMQPSATGGLAMAGAPAATAYGIIGRSALDPMGNPHDDVFDVELTPETVAGKPYAYLTYKLRGLESGHGIAKSINSNATFGTLNFTPSSHWVEATEPLKLEHLVIGTNHVRFSMPHRLDIPVEIKDVTIVFSAQPLDADATPELPGTVCSEGHAFATWPAAAGATKLALSDLEVPSIPGNIINVTRGAYAYGLAAENGTTRIGVGIDRQRIPVGMDVKDVQTYYFDYTAKRWTAITTDSLYSSPDPLANGGQGTPGEGDVNFVPSQGATQYFNGLIKSPEMPEASAFAPTSITDIKAANPAEGINIMQPPGIDKSGDAIINYPLAITPGRNGMTPQLALSYNSSQGTGMLGVGWNIGTPKITVDTRWGVPEFSPTLETELYNLNGSGLRMEGQVRANRPNLSSGTPQYTNRPSKQDVRFFEKTMTSYKEIHRHGSSPTNYYWVEITADQTKYYYGTKNGSSLDTNSIFTDPNGNIAEWMLTKVVDKWGNEIEYDYKTIKGTTSNAMLNGGIAKVVKTIYYTGHSGTKGKYSVHFTYSQNRPDATTNLRYGFKVVDEARLEKIVAKYDNAEYRNFTFNYTTGAFGKTLLQSVLENRHGQEFYRHVFGYKGMPDKIFDTQVLNIDRTNIDDPQDGIDHSEFKIDEFKKSPLSTSKSFGFSAGIYVGFGFGPGVLPSKEGTFGPAYTFNQSWTRGKNQMIDMNGDGLLDFLTRQNGQLKYLPTKKSTSGILESSTSLVGISGAQDFLRANSTSNQLAFEGYPTGGAFFGVSYLNSFSRTTSFLVDYNADGLPDIAQDGKILFAQLQSDGSVTYVGNSSNTPNPVYKGAQPAVNNEPDDDDLLEVEMVRTWRAPFSGQIEITGNPSLATGSVDGVEVAIQKNAAFIANFTPISPNGTLSLSIPTQSVTEGDLIMFRAKSVSNGFGDVLSWNPAISYAGAPVLDANDINLSNTSASNAFIVSGFAPVTIDATASVLFTWQVAPVIPAQTDEVTFKIVISGLDANENQVGVPIQYAYTMAPNTSITLGSSLFRNTATGTVMPNTATTYAINGANKLQIHFEVVSNSQVNWKAMPWQPVMSYIAQGTSAAKNAYPVVHYGIKKLVRYKGAYNLPLAFPKPSLQIYPVAAQALFSSLTVAKNAKLIIKSKQKYLRTLDVTFMPNGTVYYYNPGNPAQLPVASYNVNQAIATNALVSGDLFFEFVTDDEQLANLFKEHGSIKVYQVNTSGSTSSLSLYATTTTFNTWLNKQGGITGPDYLGHGLFAWMQSPKTAINPADIAMPSGAGLNTANLNVNNIEQELANAGLSFSTIKAMPLVPQRLEEASAQPGILPALKLPRYTFGGPNLQVHADGCAPGKFGQVAEPDPLPPLPTGAPSVNTASAPDKKVSMANEISETIGAGPLSQSGTLPTGLGSTAKNDFFDFNGDNYPDRIHRGSNALSLQKTNSYGGLVDAEVNVGADGILGKSTSSSIGLVTSGSHAYKKTDTKQKTLGLSGSETNDATEEKAAWVDVNGDGLMDKLSIINGMVHLHANNGRQLLTPVPMPLWANLLSYSTSKNTSAGLSTGAFNISKYSWSAGISMFDSFGSVGKFQADFNGDGLPDAINGTTILINQGNNFGGGTVAPSINGNYLSKNQGSGGSLNGSYTVVLPIPGTGTKVASNFSLSGNLNTSGATMMVVDVNSDGFADIVAAEKNGGNYDITIYLNQLNQVNLLEKVDNPIGGSFTLAYKAEGNRYGAYKPIIDNPTLTQPNNEKMLWDMAQQKQVLASVEVFDNVNINQNGLDDGPDSYTTTFAYDGGIYSRREREFLGFTRLETTSPSRNPNAFQADNTTRLMHTVNVVEFSKPESNSFGDRANFEYQAGLPLANYEINRVFERIESGNSGSNQPLKTETFKRLTKASYNTYTYYPVGQNAGQETFNQALLNDFLTPEDLNVGEAASVFPALTQTETFVFLDPFVDKPDSLRHYSYKYDLTYDEYFNAVRVVEHSNGQATLANWIDTGDNHVKVDNSEDPPITITKDIFALQYTPIYLGQLIAEMDYFVPDDASAHQTNMLREHRIYETSTIDANMRRKSTVDHLNASGQAPEFISQWLGLNAGTMHTSKIEYNTNGTVSKITGPANLNGDQYAVNYTYDSPNSQYVTQVSNSHTDQTCMDYNYATGTPKYTIDPNGYVMYFEYDENDRPHRIYAPREYADAAAPYTLEFAYFEQIDAQNPVPWAVTRHYTGETHKAQPVTGCTLPTWQPRTTEPNANDIIETATFIDGLGRVIQVKKDASRYNTTTQQNERVREVSGLTTYNWLGMQTQTLMSQVEQTSVTINQLNLSIFNHNATQVRYDYDLMNRVKATHTNAADDPSALTYADYTINTNYGWSQDYQNTWHFVQEVEDVAHNTPDTHVKKYFDSRSQIVATKTIDNTTAKPDILTTFTYDALGQLAQTTNPIGMVTAYNYDWFGRAYQEIHPDRGTTTSSFDKAGNVTSIATDNATVTMTYAFNRLKTKNYPQTSGLNNVTYTYGHAGDGRNGAGRVTGVVQGSNVVQEAYAYDELGNATTEDKTIAIPLVGEMRFITTYNYDSWGRLLEIKYPDDERVAYTYLPAGELYSVQRITNNGPLLDYVTGIGYDGFGNQQYMLYGNNVETNKSYNPNNRSLASVQVLSNNAQNSTHLLNKTISYHNNGNIQSISNTAASFGQGWNDLGGSYTNSYTYDFANRLTAATHQYDGQTNATNAATYQLNLSYNPAGGIETKTQNEINSTGYTTAMEYHLEYNYQNGDNDHKLETISMDYKGQQQGLEYQYDLRGNVTCINNHPELGNQSFIWDEADRLNAVQNNAGLHHYVYDHTGNRILKGSLLDNSTNQNGNSSSSGYSLTPYTVYPNAYTVCTFYADDVDVTNHYYAGAQRVASKLYQSPYKLPWSTTIDPNEEPQGPEAENPDPQQPTSFIYHSPAENNAVLSSGLNHVLHNNPPGHQCPITIDVEVDELISIGLPKTPPANTYPGEAPEYAPCAPENFTPGQIQQGQSIIAYNDCMCRFYPEEAIAQGINCQSFTEIYWYHPDYLGNTEFITDAGGYPYQFFYYSAFGESLVQQNANTGSFATPYKFNAKEQDPETGNYYYGARYYNPQVSVWLSVDAMASNGPNITPYAFSHNNPVMLMDPDGNWPDWFDNSVSSVGNAFKSAWNWVSGGTSSTQITQEKKTQEVGIPEGSCVLLPVDVAPESLGTTTGQENQAWYSVYNWPALGSSARTMDALYAGNYLDATCYFLTCLGETVTLGAGTGVGASAKAASITTSAASGVTNAVPGRLARVIPANIRSKTLGAPGTADVFVTAANDIAGLNASQLSQRLTIPNSSSGFRIIEFNTPRIGLSSPINRTNSGFVGFGRTAGGAREFTLPNQPIPNGSTIRIVR